MAETGDVSSVRLRKDEMVMLSELMSYAGLNRSRAVGEAVVYYLYSLKRKTVSRNQVETIRNTMSKFRAE